MKSVFALIQQLITVRYQDEYSIPEFSSYLWFRAKWYYCLITCFSTVLANTLLAVPVEVNIDGSPLFTAKPDSNGRIELYPKFKKGDSDPPGNNDAPDGGAGARAKAAFSADRDNASRGYARWTLSQTPCNHVIQITDQEQGTLVYMSLEPDQQWNWQQTVQALSSTQESSVELPSLSIFNALTNPTTLDIIDQALSQPHVRVLDFRRSRCCTPFLDWVFNLVSWFPSTHMPLNIPAGGYWSINTDYSVECQSSSLSTGSYDAITTSFIVGFQHQISEESQAAEESYMNMIHYQAKSIALPSEALYPINSQIVLPTIITNQESLAVNTPDLEPSAATDQTGNQSPGQNNEQPEETHNIILLESAADLEPVVFNIHTTATAMPDNYLAQATLEVTISLPNTPQANEIFTHEELSHDPDSGADSGHSKDNGNAGKDNSGQSRRKETGSSEHASLQGSGKTSKETSVLMLLWFLLQLPSSQPATNTF